MNDFYRKLLLIIYFNKNPMYKTADIIKGTVL